MKQLVFACAGFALSTGSVLADDMFRGLNVVADSDGDTEIVFDSINPEIMRMEPGDRVTLNFGEGVEAELDRVSTQEMGAQVWVGRIANHTILNRVLITQTNGFTFGRIQASDGLWLIIPEGNGHRIMQMPEGGRYLQNEHDVLLPSYEQVVSDASGSGISTEMDNIAEAVPVGSNGIIDIAVFYSQSFSARWGLATGGRVQYLMAILDQALQDSDTGLRARLVHLDSVNLTTDSQDQSVTLNNLSNNPNNDPQVTVTQDLSALRAAGVTYGADLVAILQRSLTGQSSCGLAWGLGQPATDGTINANSLPFAYSVSADWIADTDNPQGQFSLCSDLTFAHEIGHNMGFAHNVENAGGQPGGGVRTFAHGHRVDCQFTTIMAYSSGFNTCQNRPNETNEAEASYFSDPTINLCPAGASCGIAAPGQEGVAYAGVDSPSTNDPADNARAAREESLNVVSFRAEAPRVVSSVLPITRSVQNGTTATAFATIINPAATGSTATGCGLRLAGATPAQFSYQTTTPANALTGTQNTPADIAAGGSQNFLFAVTSAADFTDNINTPGFYPSRNNETDLFIEAFCGNRRSAEYRLGLNSLTFRSTAAGSADVIALAASGDPGRVNVPLGGNQVGAFAVAVSNVGNAGSITVSGDTGTQTLAVQNIEICQTDPNTGACTTPRAATQNVNLAANGTATFGVFVRGNGQAIANDPAVNRVFVRFAEGANAVGATSVAVRTQ